MLTFMHICLWSCHAYTVDTTLEALYNTYQVHLNVITTNKYEHWRLKLHVEQMLTNNIWPPHCLYGNNQNPNHSESLIKPSFVATIENNNYERMT